MHRHPPPALSRRAFVQRSAAVALCGSLARCARPHPPLAPPPTNDGEELKDAAGVLVPTDELTVRPFSVLQRVRGKCGTRDIGFECLVRLADGKLTLSGTTLERAHAFAVEQQGTTVHAASELERDVPFHPEHVLYDVHRIFFRGLDLEHAEGTFERVDGDELVRERWRHGQLVERTFHALVTFSRLVVIAFEGAPSPVIAPRIRLTNVRYGYALQIDNARQERLDGGYTLDVDRGDASGG